MKLKDIKSPRDIKNLTVEELKSIAVEMRQAVLGRCAAVSGHVGPNLGDVEAVIALHYVFDATIDSIVFDVSHQDFAHKMLTGRVDAFIDLARYSSVGEFPHSTFPIQISSIVFARRHASIEFFTCKRASISCR